MVEHAICIRCGAEKAHPYDRCGDCRFEPTPRSDDSARSLYFSEFRFSDPEAMGLWLEELETIAARLQRGERYEFDRSELQRMYSVAEALACQPLSVVYGALFRFFAPALLFLAVLWGLYLLLRWSR